MRLIDADELKSHKFLTPDNPQATRCFDEKIKAYQKGWNDAIETIIDNAPTVEPIGQTINAYTTGFNTGVETVKRPQGEWLWLCDTPNAKYKWSCNKCGRGVKEQENYCPNCGADMRGGAE
jgi:rubrerythrin